MFIITMMVKTRKKTVEKMMNMLIKDDASVRVGVWVGTSSANKTLLAVASQLNLMIHHNTPASRNSEKKIKCSI